MDILTTLEATQEVGWPSLPSRRVEQGLKAIGALPVAVFVVGGQRHLLYTLVSVIAALEYLYSYAEIPREAYENFRMHTGSGVAAVDMLVQYQMPIV